jgi:GNAT superfamily N-acetyltransferase
VTAGHENGTAGARGQLRTSHADREQAIDVLKAAFVQGRLDQGEFDARVGQAFASRTYAELTAVTGDLPAVLTGAQPVRVQARSPEAKGIRSSVRVIRAGTTLAVGVWTVALVIGSPLALTLALTFTLAYVGSLLLAGAVLLESRRELRSGGLPPPRSGPGRGGRAPRRPASAHRAFRPGLSYLAYEGPEPLGMLISHEYDAYRDQTGLRDLYIALVGTRAVGRKRGIATALLATALPAARAEGYDEASLGVDADSLTGAVRLYERVGFTVDHTRTAFQKQLL